MTTGTLTLKTPRNTTGRDRTEHRITRKKKQQRSGVSSATFATERHRMIAEAAYYRAEERGFQAGLEMLDWLAAEKNIDGRLGEAATTVII